MMKFKWLIWSFISALTILFLVSCGPSAKDKDNQEITVEETSFQSLGAYKGIIKVENFLFQLLIQIQNHQNCVLINLKK